MHYGFSHFFSFRVPRSFVHTVTVLQSYYQLMNRRMLFFAVSLHYSCVLW